MYIYGSDWHYRVDTEEGLKQFEDLYEQSPYKIIVEHEVFNITRIFPDEYRHVAFIEGDGEVNCVFTLKDNEHLMVYSGVGGGSIFNTDGMAFVRLIRDCKQVAMWSVDNSPFDYNDEEFEIREINIEDILNNIENAILESTEGEFTVDRNNTLIVGQL